MWIIKAVGLTWEKAQQALKDGLFVKIDAWHHGTDDGPVPVLLDKDGNLILRPPSTVVLADAKGRTVRHVVGRWKPSAPELATNTWQALAWEEQSA